MVTDKKTTTIVAGTVFTITESDYSDYCVEGVFRAVKDFVPDDLLDQWLAANPRERERYRFDAPSFLAWVARQGVFERVDSVNWHLGSYGTGISEVRIFDDPPQ